jgi:hypothetical protein
VSQQPSTPPSVTASPPPLCISSPKPLIPTSVKLLKVCVSFSGGLWQETFPFMESHSWTVTHHAAGSGLFELGKLVPPPQCPEKYLVFTDGIGHALCLLKF